MPQNRKYVIVKRREQVAEMYLKGRPQFEIAEILGVSSSQVSRDLKHVHKLWLEKSQQDIGIIKARELEKLDTLEREAFEAYERSCKEKVKKSMKQKGSAKKQGETNITNREQMQTTEQQVGDPRWLELVLKIVSKREEILGYGAARKLDITSKGDKMESGTVIILPAKGTEGETEQVEQEEQT